MRWPAAWAVATACLATSTGVRPAAADDEPAPRREAPDGALTIAVIAAPGDRFGLRLVAELESLGFRALVVDPGADTASRASLEASARGAGAIAAIRAVPSERGVEVWIADRVTGKTVLREVVRDDGAAPDGALALRAVELLRASLLETSLPAAPRGEVPATPEIGARLSLPPPGALARPSPPSTLRLALEPGLVVSAGGFGAAMSLDVALAWLPTEHVGVAAFAALPLGHPTVSARGGSADLTVVLAGGGLRFAFSSRPSIWAPTADIGIAVASLRSIGTATSGFVAKTSSAAGAAPYVSAGIAYAATRNFRIRADVLAAAMTRSVSIDFASNEVATWGRPIIMPSLGADFGWF